MFIVKLFIVFINNKIMCIVIVLIEILRIFYLWSSGFVVVSEILVLYVNLNFFYKFIVL